MTIHQRTIRRILCFDKCFAVDGCAGSSLVINLSRQGLIYIPALFILEAPLGINGLVWAQPIADVISIAVAALLYIIVSKKMMKEKANNRSVIVDAVHEAV